MDLREEFRKENNCCDNCDIIACNEHWETGDYFDNCTDYTQWLESKLKEEQEKNQKLLEILRLGYIHYYGHSKEAKEIYEAITGKEIDK